MSGSELFNKDQLKAIKHLTGPAMVIAGPGSGKTTVITNRIRYLIDSGAARPSEILVITFTAAAASEMRSRFIKLSSDSSNTSEPCFGTFHSIFYHFLREHPAYSNLRLAEQSECVNILKQIVLSIIPDNTFTSDYYIYLLNEISRQKTSLCSEPCMPLVTKVMPRYCADMLDAGLVDFDDMLVLCLKLMQEEPSVLRYLRNKYRFLMIDEFQDIDGLQFEIVRLLAAPHNNIFVVGDDDQSIYGFRGSDPGIMLKFRDYYPDASFIELFTNYRSSKPIVRAASRLISYNKLRFDKNFEAVSTCRLGIDYVSYRDREEEAEAIVRDILSLPREIESVAVLFRTHRTGNALKSCIDRKIHTAFMQENTVRERQYNKNQVPELYSLSEELRTDSKALKPSVCNVEPRMDAKVSVLTAGSRSITERLSAVNLMTFHASKGLEFDAVYIISANEGITPLKSAGNDEIEEERRLFYVALTRAKKYVHISDIFTLYNKTQKMSRFVRESLGLLKTMNVLRHLQ